MTAEMIDLFPVGNEADDTVRNTVKALIKGRGTKVDSVADAVGIARSTLYKRLKGDGAQQAFRAGEVAQLARYFRVPIGDIYAGLNGTFRPTDPDGSPRLNTVNKLLLNGGVPFTTSTGLSLVA